MKITFTPINKIRPIQKMQHILRNNNLLKTEKQAIPIITAPIICYDIYNNNLKKLFDAMQAAGIEIPNYLSVSPISNSGLDETSKSKVRQKIYAAFEKKEIDEKTKNDLLSKVSFTGNSQNDTNNIDSELAEIDNIDESLPPDLAEFLATPVDPAGEGLIDNIMDLDDSELGADDNFFSMVKNFLADSADWF